MFYPTIGIKHFIVDIDENIFFFSFYDLYYYAYNPSFVSLESPSLNKVAP